MQVSEIGFGTWNISGDWGVVEEQDALTALGTAFDRGITFYDTAMGYGGGRSECLLGEAFHTRRDQVVIASKVAPNTGQWPALETDDVQATFSKAWIIKNTEESLKRLKTDYLDVQQLHCWAASWLRQGDWQEAVAQLKRQGKIRYFGVSANDWDPYNTVSLVESGLVDSIQVIYNLFEQRPAEQLLPAALKHKVAIIVRVPFEEGLLTGKIRPGHRWTPGPWGQGDWRARWMTEERLLEAEPHIVALEKELDEQYPDLPTLALKFILAHPAVSVVIPGMRSLRNVQLNTAVSDIPPMPEAKLQRLYEHKWYHGWLYPWDKRLK